MRIDAYSNYNANLNMNVYDLPEKDNTAALAPVEAVKPINADAFSVADIYEKGSSRPKTDFGGYTRFGRKTSDVQKEQLQSYMVGSVASILRTNTDSLTRKMDKMGLTSEDMVDPAKAMSLTNNLAQKYRIFEYTMEQRNLMKDELNMDDSQLDEFVDDLKNAEFPAPEGESNFITPLTETTT